MRSPLLLALGGSLLLATSAVAAPKLSVQPVFSPVRVTDPWTAQVLVENDDQPRRVVLTARRSEGRSWETSARTEMPLELAPHARKSVLLPLAPGGGLREIVELEQDGDSIAVEVMKLDFATDDPLVAAIAPMPPGLWAAARGPLDFGIAEVTVALPADLATWPSLQALAWNHPRSADIPKPLADALRAYVSQGGRLVVSPSPEEPEALASAGLGDLLPARPVSDGAIVSWADPADGAQDVGAGALAVTRGFGSVVLVPGSLDAVPADAWGSLVAISQEPTSDVQRLRQARLRAWRSRRVDGADWALALISPKPPIAAATIALVAFLLATLADAILARRAVKAGRRRRFGILGFVAIAACFSIVASVVAEAATRGGRHSARLDLVDVASDGVARGRSFVFAANGSGAPITLLADDEDQAAIRRAGPIAAYEEDAGDQAVHHARADARRCVDRATVAAGAWVPAYFETRWTPRGVPAAHPGPTFCDEPIVPACDGASFSQCGILTILTRALPAGRMPQKSSAPDDALASLLRLGREPLDDRAGVVLAWKGRALGPELHLRGAPDPPASQTVSIVTYLFQPGDPRESVRR